MIYLISFDKFVLLTMFLAVDHLVSSFPSRRRDLDLRVRRFFADARRLRAPRDAKWKWEWCVRVPKDTLV